MSQMYNFNGFSILEVIYFNGLVNYIIWMVGHIIMIVCIVRQLVELAHMFFDCIMIALFLGNVILWLIWLYDFKLCLLDCK